MAKKRKTKSKEPELFSVEYAASLPEDSLEAIEKVVDDFLGKNMNLLHNTVMLTDEKSITYLRAFALLYSLAKQCEFPLPQYRTIDGYPTSKSIAKVFEESKSNLDTVYKGIITQRNESRFHALIESFDGIIKKEFAYEFSEGDFKRIQKLIDELRHIITESAEFEDDHKRRVIKKLEKLQVELNKRMSSLDVFWGLLGEAGVALGKFGKDAKPFVDSITELLGIAWRTQAMAEQLESGLKMPLLAAPDPDDDKTKKPDKI